MGTQNYLEKQNPAQGGREAEGGAELILPGLRTSHMSERNGPGSGTRRRWHPARPETRGAESACDGTPTSSRTNLTCKRKEELAQVSPGLIRSPAEPRRPGELRLPGSNRILMWSSGEALAQSPCGQELPWGRGLCGNPPPYRDSARTAPGPAET